MIYEDDRVGILCVGYDTCWMIFSTCYFELIFPLNGARKL